MNTIKLAHTDKPISIKHAIDVLAAVNDRSCLQELFRNELKRTRLKYTSDTRVSHTKHPDTGASTYELVAVANPDSKLLITYDAADELLASRTDKKVDADAGQYAGIV